MEQTEQIRYSSSLPSADLDLLEFMKVLPAIPEERRRMIRFHDALLPADSEPWDPEAGVRTVFWVRQIAPDEKSNKDTRAARDKRWEECLARWECQDIPGWVWVLVSEILKTKNHLSSLTTAMLPARRADKKAAADLRRDVIKQQKRLADCFERLKKVEKAQHTHDARQDTDYHKRVNNLDDVLHTIQETLLTFGSRVAKLEQASLHEIAESKRRMARMEKPSKKGGKREEARAEAPADKPKHRKGFCGHCGDPLPKCAGAYMVHLKEKHPEMHKAMAAKGAESTKRTMAKAGTDQGTQPKRKTAKRPAR